MKTLPTALLCLFLSNAGCSTETPNTIPYKPNTASIIGGDAVNELDPIAKLTLTLINNRNRSLCTAVVISRRTLLTAAHCVENTDVTQVEVRLGLQPGHSESVLKVDSILIHPLYSQKMSLLTEKLKTATSEDEQFFLVNNEKDWSDLALVHTRDPLPIGFHNGAVLLEDSSLLSLAEKITLAGFGIEESNQKRGFEGIRLMKVIVEMSDPLYSESEFTVNQTNGRGACHGDSGGPAFISVKGQLILAGITSRGIDDCKDTCGVRAAYTSVAPYSSWIKNSIVLLRETERLASANAPSI